MIDSLKPAPFKYEDYGWVFIEIPEQKPNEAHYLGFPKIKGRYVRKYQITYYEKIKGKRRTLLIAPTGCGKSFMLTCQAAKTILTSNYTRKQIISVPQLVIAKSFRAHTLLKIDNKEYGYEIAFDCCNNDTNSVKTIKDFLLNTIPSCNAYKSNNIIGGITALVSHAAIISAFNSMNEEEKQKALENTDFYFDEIHHVAGVEDGYTTNQLGNLCEFILINGDKHKTGIHLATATFFRGDSKPIFSEEWLSKFEVFRVPFMDHWKMLNLRSFIHEFETYTDADNLLDIIVAGIKFEPDKLPLIIVPPNGHKFFLHPEEDYKFKWVARLVAELNTIYGEDKVLDLVTPSRQKKDKERYMSDTKDQDFSAVVTCMIGREGADWVPCSRIYNTVLDNSALQPIQKMGRALRHHSEKVDVKMITFIPYFDDWDKDSESVRRCISDRFNAVVAVSMECDLFSPILIQATPKTKNKRKAAKRTVMVTLEDIYGSSKNSFIKELYERNASLPLEQRKDSNVVDGVILDVIEEYRENMLMDAKNEDLLVYCRKELIKLNPNIQISNLMFDDVACEFIRKEGWDKICREYPFSPFVGAVDTTQFRKLQNILKKKYKYDQKEMDNEILELSARAKELRLKGDIKGSVALKPKSTSSDSHEKILARFLYKRKLIEEKIKGKK